MPTSFYTDGFDTGNSAAWVLWNDQWQTTATMTTVTYTTTADTTWATWTGVDTTGTTCDYTWTQWVSGPCGGTVTYATPGHHLSEEEIAAERARIQEAADQRQAERLEATRKAKALLHAMLTVKQREQLERDKFFDFVSQTGRRMRIKAHSYSRNIDELGPDGKRLRTLCAHPRADDLPLEDHLTAQLLALRHNEEEFLRHANVS